MAKYLDSNGLSHFMGILKGLLHKHSIPSSAFDTTTVPNVTSVGSAPTLGTAFTIADRLEISGGYGGVNAHRYGDRSINTYNVGAKLKFLDENAFDTSWVPALAVGGVYKYTDSKTVDALGLDSACKNRTHDEGAQCRRESRLDGKQHHRKA